MTIKNTFFLLVCLFLGLSNTFLEEPPAPPATKGILDLENLFNYANQYIPEKAILNHNGGNPITDLGATLGRVLFYDKKLSLNSTTACASCHQQENAFGDTRKVSIGFDGKPTARHSMRLINVDFSPDHLRFWDKRGISLEGTVTLPFQDEIEMGFSGTNGQPTMDSLLSRMETIPYYPALFKEVYGDEAITERRMQLALAQFIRSILSYDAKFDVGFEEVGEEISAFPNFTEEENEGKRLFFSFPPFNGPQTERSGAFCGVCHKVPSFSILHFAQSNGIIGVAGDSTAIDITVGRSPSIRDLVKPDGSSNGPFMHDGSLADLEAIVDHYNDIPANPANPNLSGLLFPNDANDVKLNLTDDHKAALVAFLKTLSGNDVYVNEKWANPFDEADELQLVFGNDCTTIQSSLAITLCAGDQYQGLSQSGVYTNRFTAASGCDSIETLTLEVLPLSTTSLDQTICAGDSFLGYATSGTFVDTLDTPAGCKEIRTLTLAVLPLSRTSFDQTICAGESFLGYAASGTYVDTLDNSTGCKEVRTLTLEVLPFSTTSLDQTICAGESFLGYTASGTFVDTLDNLVGCKEVRTLILDVLPYNTTVLEETICAGESFLGYFVSGTYVDTLDNLAACDTLRTLELTVLEAEDENCLQTSLSDLQIAPNINAFPNPFTESIYFQNLPTDNYEWSLINTTGQLVESGQLSRTSTQVIQLSATPSGLYLLQLRPVNTERVQVFKLLKE